MSQHFSGISVITSKKETQDIQVRRNELYPYNEKLHRERDVYIYQ